MYAFRVTEEIAASPGRVWRALCDPGEVVSWDTGVSEAIDAPDDYPAVGQHVRWRYRQGAFRVLHDRPVEVRAERLLRAALSVGPYRFDETYTLAARVGGCRLTADLVVRVTVPVVGRVIARRWIGPRTRAAVAGSLAALKEWCERRP